MTDRIGYKEFIGSVHYSDEDEIFYGHIEGINDLVPFEGTTVNKLKTALREAVNDHVEIFKTDSKNH